MEVFHHSNLEAQLSVWHTHYCCLLSKHVALYGDVCSAEYCTQFPHPQMHSSRKVTEFRKRARLAFKVWQIQKLIKNNNASLKFTGLRSLQREKIEWELEDQFVAVKDQAYLCSVSHDTVWVITCALRAQVCRSYNVDFFFQDMFLKTLASTVKDK